LYFIAWANLPAGVEANDLLFLSSAGGAAVVAGGFVAEAGGFGGVLSAMFEETH